MPVQECRKCGKERNIQNKTLGWCRGCLLKQHARYNRTKILPHPEKYNAILELVAAGWNQKQIAKGLVISRQTVQRVCSRYTVPTDAKGNEWRH